MDEKKVITLHKRIRTMKKERKAFILARVREIANSEHIDGAMRKDLQEFCSELGVEYRVGNCDNCARDTAVQIYSILRTKGGADRVCVLKNERYHYVWSAKGKAHIYPETLTDEFARELLAKGIVKDDFFAVLPPTEEEEEETERKKAEEEEAARKAYEAEQSRLAEEAMNMELVETTKDDSTAETAGQ